MILFHLKTSDKIRRFNVSREGASDAEVLSSYSREMAAREDKPFLSRPNRQTFVRHLECRLDGV